MTKMGNSCMIIKIKYCQFWGMLIFMLLLSNSVAGQNNVESSKAPKLSTQSSAGFVMYTYDSESPIGISFGRINKNRIQYDNPSIGIRI